MKAVQSENKWTCAAMGSQEVAVVGHSTDVWIFQISGNLTMASAQSVLLSGGALQENIIWQVAGFVTLGSTAHSEGIVLCQTNIAVGNLATVNGRLFSQTEISLDQATVTQP